MFLVFLNYAPKGVAEFGEVEGPDKVFYDEFRQRIDIDMDGLAS